MKNGLFEENGRFVYYKDGVLFHAGVVRNGDDIYYIGENGCAIKGKHTVHSSMTNGILEHGVYVFGDDYKLVGADTDKNGLFQEDGELVFYRYGRLSHAGVIKIGDDIYYIAAGGKAVKGKHSIHGEMTNGILKSGIYTFGDDYKLIPGSYIRPKKNKKKNSNKKKSKNKLTLKQKIWIAVAAVLVVALVVTAVVIDYKGILYVGSGGNKTSDAIIELPVFEDEVLLCSDFAKKTYEGEMTVTQAISGGDPYKPFIFQYSIKGDDGKLLISEYPDLRSAREYVLPSDTKTLSINNLKTGTVYYYKVTADGNAQQGFFRTAKSTRFVNIPGVSNTRDIGGYKALDGKTVKQGLLIRGTELDGLVDAKYSLSRDADESVKNDFGFKYDFDLRSPDIFAGKYQSRLAEGAEHKFYNSPSYGAIFTESGQSALRKIFTDLADPANYPMYLHDTHGCDRVGTVCFLLEGVLGVSEEDMFRDYQLSGFFKQGYCDSKSLNPVYNGLQGYKGNTVGEKIVSFLVEEAGVTETQIASIRNIFLVNE